MHFTLQQEVHSRVSPIPIRQSNASKKVTRNWHLAFILQQSLQQMPIMVFRTRLYLQKIKGRWSIVIGIFVILRFLRGRHSSPHLVRSDPIDQGTIVTSPSAPLSPLLSPLTCVAIDLPNHKTILLDTGLPSQYVFNLLEKALHHTTHWSSRPTKD